MGLLSGQFEFGGDVAWRPTAEYVEKSRLRQFMSRHGIGSYDELLRRSVADLEWFWSAVLDDLAIEFYERPSQIVDTSPGIPWTRWCVGVLSTASAAPRSPISSVWIQN